MIDLTLLDKAMEEKRIHVFKNVFSEIPDWADFIKLLNVSIEKDLRDIPDESVLDRDNIDTTFLSFKRKARMWSRLTFQLCDHSDPIENYIPKAQQLVDLGKSIYKQRYGGNFALISLFPNRGDIGSKHEDYVDQFQWNCIGNAIWRTGANLETETYIEPGDLIFIPRNIMHEIETVSPRAVINLVINNE